jgi:hypothetical protein
VALPELSRFLGISIRMYFNDHDPPHFHVKYNDDRAVFRIRDLMMTKGKLPGRVTALVLEWANLHREELQANWESLKRDGVFSKIDPLV